MTALQVFVTRRVNVFDPAVITIGKIAGGSTDNVIPESAELLGTIRTVSEASRDLVHAGIARMAQSIAAAHECEADVKAERGFPVTVNDARAVAFAEQTITSLFGAESWLTMKAPLMGAEDFSYVLQKVPGAMMFLGGTHPDRNPSTAPQNHSNRVWFDEDAMPTGVALYAAMALRQLGAA